MTFARLYPGNHEVAKHLGLHFAGISGGLTFRDVTICFSRFEVLMLSIDSKRRGGFKRVGSATKDITQISKICSLNIKIVLFTGTGGFYSGMYPWFVSSVFFSKFSSLNYTG